MIANILKDLNLKSRTLQNIDDCSIPSIQGQNQAAAAPSSEFKFEDINLNKRVIKALQKKLSAAQIRKIVCQAAETGQAAHSNFRSKIRKLNDSVSSRDLLNDRQQDLDEPREELRPSNCNNSAEADPSGQAHSPPPNLNNAANQLINHDK